MDNTRQWELVDYTFDKALSAWAWWRICGMVWCVRSMLTARTGKFLSRFLYCAAQCLLLIGGPRSVAGDRVSRSGVLVFINTRLKEASGQCLFQVSSENRPGNKHAVKHRIIPVELFAKTIPGTVIYQYILKHDLEHHTSLDNKTAL